MPAPKRGALFCSLSDLRDTGERPARYGLPWTPGEFQRVAQLFKASTSLKTICAMMQRPPSGVVTKLHALKLVDYDTMNGCYYFLPTKKDITMSEAETKIARPSKAPTIESKTFISGVDAASLTDLEIFEKISSLEQSLKRWEAMSERPKKLEAMITNIKNDIKKLSDYVDARA